MALVPHLVIPIWKRGALSFESHFHMGISCQPFPFGDPHYGNWMPYILNPYKETVIHRSYKEICRFLFPADPKMSVSQPKFLVTCRCCVTQWTAKTTVPVSTRGLPKCKRAVSFLKIPYGDSPFQNRVCDFSLEGKLIAPLIAAPNGEMRK
jgi:hypothetical protein